MNAVGIEQLRQMRRTPYVLRTAGFTKTLVVAQAAAQFIAVDHANGLRAFTQGARQCLSQGGLSGT
ncbi:MAG: hypothetical protein RR336_04565 [Oscillospiraceae bacterium]